MKAQTTYGEKVADAGVRFAFYGRVSTEDNQDPTLSLPRQLANCEKAVAEAGGRVVAHFYAPPADAPFCSCPRRGTN